MKDIAAILMTRSMTIEQALMKIDQSGMGLLLLTDDKSKFERTITDGDLRRLLIKGHTMHDTLSGLPVINSMALPANYTRQEALALMNEHSINHLPVLDGNDHVLEVLERKELDQQILLSTPHMGPWEQEFVDEAFR